MARARNIKPGFFRNADLVELPVETRLLFIGLWTLADREGRLEDRPKQIKMEIYPADSFDVGSMLGQLHAAGFINRYEVGSSKFIEVQNFIKHQDPHYKEKASEIPPPPGQENFMKATGITRMQRQRILERDGNECKSCGAKESLCMDHIIPVSRGGDSSDENLQVLCSACNTKKGNKIDGEEKNSRQRRVNVGSNSIQRNDASPSEPGFLNPDPPILIQGIHSVAKATADAPLEKSLSEKSKTELWQAAVSLLAGQGVPEPQARTLIGKLSKDYKSAGEDIVFTAVQCAVSAQPADARAYLKATCQMLAGQRKHAANTETFKERDDRLAAERIAEFMPGIAAKNGKSGVVIDINSGPFQVPQIPFEVAQ